MTCYENLKKHLENKGLNDFIEINLEIDKYLTEAARVSMIGLIEKYYPELQEKNIPLEIHFGENKFRPLIYTTSIGLSFKTFIIGNYPKSMLCDERKEKIERGLLAHELSHIVNGDLSIFNSVKGFIKQVFGMQESDSVIIKREKRADLTLISRGLGEDYLTAVQYMIENYPGNITSFTFSYGELEGMVFKK